MISFVSHTLAVMGGFILGMVAMGILTDAKKTRDAIEAERGPSK